MANGGVAVVRRNLRHRILTAQDRVTQSQSTAEERQLSDAICDTGPFEKLRRG